MYDLESIALVHQELLSLVREVHLLGIRGHQRVKVRIEIIQICIHLCLGISFGPQNSAKSLCFLLSRAKMGGDLNDDIGRGKVDGGVTDFGHEDGVQ